MEIPSEFAARIRTSLGVGGRRWLAALPGVLDELAARWQIEIGAPFDLSFNYVARAMLADGQEAVLKLAPPWEDGEFEREIHALTRYDGRGACRPIAADLERRALLLERLRPGDLLAQVAAEDDDRATTIGAETMRALWQPAAALPNPVLFRPLADWFQAFDRHRTEYGGPGPFTPAVLAHAEAVTADLLGSAPTTVLLHADLHHFNILSSERAGWLAIDPKGMLGDPGYEVGPFLLNPWSDRVPKPPALLRRRLDILAHVLVYDRNRLRDWGIAHAVLSACWSAEHGGDGWQSALGTAHNLIGL